MSKLTTEYGATTAVHDVKKNKSKKIHDYYNQINAAGVTRYLEKSKSQQVMPPLDFKNAQVEDKIKGVQRYEEIHLQLNRKHEDDI